MIVARKTPRSPRSLLHAALMIVPMLVACGASGPPPRPAEVPIDQFQATPVAGEAAGQPATAEAPATEPPAAGETGGPSGARPTQMATQAPAAIGPPPGQRLTSAECGRLVDRGAILYGISQGMSPKQANKALATLRNSAVADPTYSQVHGSCLQQNSKPQYLCGLKQLALEKWKACFE